MRSRSPVISGKINSNGTVAIAGAFTSRRIGTGNTSLDFAEPVSSLAFGFDNATIPGTSIDISAVPAAGTGGRSWSIATRQPGVSFADIGYTFIATRLNQGG